MNSGYIRDGLCCHLSKVTFNINNIKPISYASIQFYMSTEFE
jgi:hypothetical protein